MSARRAGALLGAWLLLSAARPALAGDSEIAAREAFGAGDAAFNRKDYRAAALAYETAFRLAPNGVAAYNAALAWKSAGEPAREADDLALALAAPGLPEPKIQSANTRLAALAPSLAVVAVEAPAGARISVAHVDRATSPLSVHVAPGAIEVVVELAGGARETRSVLARAGQTASVKIAEPVVLKPPTPVETPRKPLPGVSPQRTAGWVTLAVGGLSASAAIGMGVGFVQAKQTFDASAYHDKAAHDLAETFRIGASIAAAGAGVLALTGTVLVLTARNDVKAGDTALRPGALTVTVGPSGLSLRGSF
jgi:hypothetical protein